MHEYVDLAVESGCFPDPRLVYELTLDEIKATIAGANAREKQLQKAENIRAGTVCACIYNQNRKRRNDKIWKWSDFFPEHDLKKAPDQDKIREDAIKIMKMFNGGMNGGHA